MLYDVEGCNCCTCSIGLVDVALKGGGYVPNGYAQFTGADRLFRSLVSRGWGTESALGGYAMYNEILCSYSRTFEIPSVVTPRYGSMLSQWWAVPPPVDPVATPPDVEETDCAEAFFDFNPQTQLFNYRQAYAISAAFIPQHLPRGETWIFNEITPEETFAEAREYVEGLSYPTAATGLAVTSARHLKPTAGSTAGFVYYERVQYRRRFPIPINGSNVRLEWEIYFKPQAGGSTVLYDTVSFQWDKVVPPGYDRADEETWPVTPWYETPDFTGDYGTYYIPATIDAGFISATGVTTHTGCLAKCGRSASPGTPGAMSGTTT